MTSRKTSFFLYSMPSGRHDTAVVRVEGGFTITSILWLSCVIYLQKNNYTFLPLHRKAFLQISIIDNYGSFIATSGFLLLNYSNSPMNIYWQYSLLHLSLLHNVLLVLLCKYVLIFKPYTADYFFNMLKSTQPIELMQC